MPRRQEALAWGAAGAPATRGLGIAALGCYAVHGSFHLINGRPEDLLWACHLGAALVGIGLLVPSPIVTVLGTLFLSLGTPLWLMDLAAGGVFHPTSCFTHFGGLAIGLYGTRLIKHGRVPSCSSSARPTPMTDRPVEWRAAFQIVLSYVSTNSQRNAPLKTFNIRDLRQRTGTLVREAEEGGLSLVTKHGRAVFLAVPLSERLLEAGVHQALALHLYEHGVVSLSKAARLAEVPVERFLRLLSAAGVDAVRYPPEELEDELRHLA